MNKQSWLALQCWKTFSRALHVCRGWTDAAVNDGWLDRLMRVFNASLFALVIAAVSFAGCAGDDDGDDDQGPTTTPAPNTTSYTIVLEGFPVGPIPANTTFSFNDHITGDATRTSDHIGAHFGPNSTMAPSTTAYPVACQHTPGSLPGTFPVTCTAPKTAGTYFLRGHARIGQGNQSVSWWSAEQPFVVV